MKSDTGNFHQPIAIIGMGCLFPQSPHIKSYFRLIGHQKNAIIKTPDSHWSAEDYYNSDPKTPDHTYCTNGAFLDPVPFDPTEFGIPPNTIEATDSSQLLGLIVARKALLDAGYDTSFDHKRTSVILGVTGTQELVIPLGARLGYPKWKKALLEEGIDKDHAEQIIQRMKADYVSWQENSFPGLLGNVVAGRISNRLNLGGTNTVVDAACASSLSALHLAILELSSHQSDMCITGGVDTLNDIFMHMCFAQTGVLSSTGDAKPFSEHADGTVLGEGIGMVILKRLTDAERAGDKIYAVVKGIGTSSDGKSQSIYAPNVIGQQNALELAYKRAGVAPHTIGLVEAHGTGIRVSDAVEFEALKTVFEKDKSSGNDNDKRCALGSVKSNIGHTKAAAGAAGLIKAVLSLQHKIMLPTIKADPIDTNLNINESPFYIITEKKPWLNPDDHPRRAGVSAFGFGGSNFHAVIEEYESEKKEISWDGSVHIFAISSQESDQLIQDLKKFQKTFNDNPGSSQLARLAYQSRLQFNPNHSFRLLLVIEEGQNPIELVQKALNTFDEKGAIEPFVIENIYYGTVACEKGDVAFLFPGQGSQYPRMGRDLACAFPQAQHIFNRVNEKFKREYGTQKNTLSDYIYPYPDHIISKTDTEDLLRNTDVAQPAIGAVSCAMLDVITSFGIQSNACCGHSYGELTALNGANWIDRDVLLDLSIARGKYMAAAGPDSGTMIAVKAPLEKLKTVIQDNNLDVVLANLNSPQQGVLSGSREAISAAAKILKQNKIRSIPLPVAAAFHSQLVASAVSPFKKYLEKKTITPNSVSVLSNTTGDFYPQDGKLSKEILGSQLLNPVNFVSNIDALYQKGIRTFIEVGPKTVLTGLVKTILKGQKFNAMAIDASSGKKNGMGDLARCLAHLASLGFSIKLSNWEEPEPETPPQKMSVPISGTNYKQSKPGLKKEKPKSKPMKPKDNNKLNQTLNFIQDGLKTMQMMQAQTTQAHQKFLETQKEASQTLQSLINKIQPYHTQTDTYQSDQDQVHPHHIKKNKTHPEAAKPNAGVLESTIQNDNKISTQNEMNDLLFKTVSTLTGYPVDMLNQEMDIEADLGIDSIKRVEIFSAMEEQIPDLEKASPDVIGALKTLGDVGNYLKGQNLSESKKHDQAQSHTPMTSTNDKIKHNQGEIQTHLFDVISQLTGYPEDMLELSMDMETDLGIDSIKRVEILSIFEERIPNLPSLSPDALSQVRTIKQIVDYTCASQKSSLSVEENKDPRVVGNDQKSDEPRSIALILKKIVSELTGYPVDMLSLSMDMEMDLGIDSIKRVEILSTLEEHVTDLPAINPEQLGNLRTLGQICEFLETPVHLSPPESRAQAHNVSIIETQAPIERRVIGLDSVPFADKKLAKSLNPLNICILSDGSSFAALIENELIRCGHQPHLIAVDAFNPKMEFPQMDGAIFIFTENNSKMANNQFLINIFQAAQVIGKQFNKTEKKHSILFAGITCMDGTFGLRMNKDINPFQGGIPALIKTARLEWANVHCRVLDVDPDWKMDRDAAQTIVAELFAPGPVEVGLSKAEKIYLSLNAQTVKPQPAFLSSSDIILITGGARGVTAQCALSLAKEFKATYILVGRSELMDEEPEWLKGLTETGEMKQAIWQHEFKGQKVSPKKIASFLGRYMANREIKFTLSQMKDLGVSAFYYATDIQDHKAVTGLVKDVQKEYGAISAIIHGAGVVQDRFILDKSLEQFSTVYGIKINGIQNLLTTIKSDSLKYLVFFSSVSARFGNVGQVDYAMANEVLNKLALHEQRNRPHCHVVSLNWGPWDGGMVTRSLKENFLKKGISLIPIKQGAQAMLVEMGNTSNNPVEIILGNELGKKDDQIPHFQTKKFDSKDKLTIVFKRDVSLQNYPILNSHILKGKPVVPFALMTEWVGYSALHDNPDLCLYGIDEMRLLKGIKIDGNKKTIRLLTGKPKRKGNRFEIAIEVRNGFKDGKKVVHSSAKALLSHKPARAPKIDPVANLILKPYERSISDVYEKILFHGHQLRGLKEILAYSDKGITAMIQPAPPPLEWMTEPLRSRWLSDPLILDSAFQLAIVWCFEQLNSVCLPSYYAKYRQFCTKFPKDDVKALLSIDKITKRKMTGDFLFLDKSGQMLAQLKGYEAIIDKDLIKAFKTK